MILTKEAILKEIGKGRVKITPFKKENIGPGSIDLTLGRGFRICQEPPVTNQTFPPID